MCWVGIASVPRTRCGTQRYPYGLRGTPHVVRYLVSCGT